MCSNNILLCPTVQNVLNYNGGLIQSHKNRGAKPYDLRDGNKRLKELYLSVTRNLNVNPSTRNQINYVNFIPRIYHENYNENKRPRDLLNWGGLRLTVLLTERAPGPARPMGRWRLGAPSGVRTNGRPGFVSRMETGDWLSPWIWKLDNPHGGSATDTTPAHNERGPLCPQGNRRQRRPRETPWSALNCKIETSGNNYTGQLPRHSRDGCQDGARGNTVELRSKNLARSGVGAFVGEQDRSIIRGTATQGGGDLWELDMFSGSAFGVRDVLMASNAVLQTDQPP